MDPGLLGVTVPIRLKLFSLFKFGYFSFCHFGPVQVLSLDTMMPLTDQRRQDRKWRIEEMSQKHTDKGHVAKKLKGQNFAFDVIAI